MQTINISLVDTDYVIHAKAKMTGPDNKIDIIDLFQHLNDDFVQGEDAILEVDGLRNGRAKFAISRVEA